MERARGGWRPVMAAVSAVLIVAVLVAWDRYESAHPVAAGVAQEPLASSRPDAEAQESPVRGASPRERRLTHTPDFVVRWGAADRAEAPQPAPVLHGTGTFVVAVGTGDPVGRGPVRRYLVEVEDGTRVDPDDFAAKIEHILSDQRGWTADPRYGFRRVDEGPVDFRVTLASPETVDRECLPLRTNSRFSCWNGSRAMLNLRRWLEGADAYGDDLRNYRRYLVNHEVGHALGHGHVGCPGGGQPAPTMMQQSIGVGACEPNPWPHPRG